MIKLQKFITMLVDEYIVSQSINYGRNLHNIEARKELLSDGRVYFYAPGSTTPAKTYMDEGLTIALSNPMVLDSAGMTVKRLFAKEDCDFRVSNSTGQTIGILKESSV